MTEHSPLSSLATSPNDISIVSELLNQLKVRDVMTRSICTVTPDKTLRVVQHLMRDKKISGVPVVEGSRLIGIISLDDIIRALDRGEINMRVWEKMSRRVVTVEDHVSVVKAIDEMEKSGFGRLPVLDKDGDLVGILTHWDVVRKLVVMLQEVAMQAEQRERSILARTGSSQPEVTTLDFDVEHDDFENAGRASSAVKKALQARNVDPAVIRRVAVGMYEAELNIVIHSTGGTMAARIYSDRIEVAALDRGPGIADVNLAMKEGFSTASEKVREMGFGAGMGLPNIKRCSDVFTISSALGEHTEVSFTVFFTPQKPTPPSAPESA